MSSRLTPAICPKAANNKASSSWTSDSRITSSGMGNRRWRRWRCPTTASLAYAPGSLFPVRGIRSCCGRPRPISGSRRRAQAGGGPPLFPKTTEGSLCYAALAKARTGAVGGHGGSRAQRKWRRSLKARRPSLAAGPQCCNPRNSEWPKPMRPCRWLAVCRAGALPSRPKKKPGSGIR